MGLTPVRAEELAAIVTSLEMTQRPRPKPLPDSELRLVRWPAPTLAGYRKLFRRVGEPWLWYSRLVMDDERLAAILEAPGISVHAVVDPTGVEVGMVELDHRQDGTCEIAYFALIPELAGKGHGRWLMTQALSLAWRPDVERVWLHTCTLDHPNALGFYRKMGFTPYKRTIETFADPRVTGLISSDAAPQVPLLGEASRR